MLCFFFISIFWRHQIVFHLNFYSDWNQHFLMMSLVCLKGSISLFYYSLVLPNFILVKLIVFQVFLLMYFFQCILRAWNLSGHVFMLTLWFLAWLISPCLVHCTCYLYDIWHIFSSMVFVRALCYHFLTNWSS